jgi:ATP-dependent RNA helicase DBP3
LREAGSNVPEDLMKFGTGVKRKTHGMYGDFYKSADERPMKAAVKVTFD